MLLRTGSLIIFCTCFAFAQYKNSFAGPYDIQVKQIAQCENRGLDVTRFDKTRIVKYNRTTYLYSSNFSLPYGFNDKVMLGMSSLVYGNGGWKMLQKDQKIGPACSTVKRLSPKLVDSVTRAMGTWPTPCPYPPGNYTVKDLPLNIELEIPILPYNRYMFEIWLAHKGVRTGCGKIYLDIVPKNTRKRKI